MKSIRELLTVVDAYGQPLSEGPIYDMLIKNGATPANAKAMAQAQGETNFETASSVDNTNELDLNPRPTENADGDDPYGIINARQAVEAGQTFRQADLNRGLAELKADQDAWDEENPDAKLDANKLVDPNRPGGNNNPFKNTTDRYAWINAGKPDIWPPTDAAQTGTDTTEPEVATDNDEVGGDGMTDVERQAGAGAKPSTAQQAANTYAGGDVQGGEFGNTPTAKTTAQAAADEYAGGDTTNGEFGANPNDPMSAANQAKDRRAPADPNDPMSAANQAKDRVSPNDPMSAANQAKDRQAPLQDPTGGVGGADAAAKAANDAPISVTAPKAAQPAKPARLDIKTPNLMKAYNAGGKKAMPNIKTMQLALSKAGHDPKGNDGKYGPGTFAAVKSFQQANGLTADGQAGPSTMKKLQLVSQTVKEASMNISMNGTDSKEVADLVDILKNAGVEKPEELAMKNMPTMSLSGPNSPLNKGPIGIDSFDGGPMDDTPRSSMDRPSSGPFDGGPMDDTPRSSMGMDKPAAMGKDKDSKPCGCVAVCTKNMMQLLQSGITHQTQLTVMLTT